MEAIHHVEINTTKDLLETIKAGKCVWPGGYEINFLTSSGTTLHYQCVKDNLMQECRNIKDDMESKVTGTFVNYEEEDLYCEWCNEAIKPEYEY